MHLNLTIKSKYKYAPIITVEVERRFFSLTNILTKKRTSLSTEHLIKLFTVQCNSFESVKDHFTVYDDRIYWRRSYKFYGKRGRI